jgi:hypothetical protein
MLEPVRFTTNDPAKLAGELDRFVRSVARELGSRPPARWSAITTVSGRTGLTTIVYPKLDELVPVNPSLGAVDLILPRPSAADAGRSVLVTLGAVTYPCRLLPGPRAINAVSSPITLPSTLAAYLAVWDGAGWWTVNDA